jgi:hypothetical protein
MLETLPDIQIVDGVVQVDATMMTGRPESSPAATWFLPPDR